MRRTTNWAATASATPPRIYTADKSLVIQRVESPGEALPNLSLSPAMYDLALAWRDDHVVAVFTSGGRVRSKADLRRVSEGDYRRQANLRADQAMRFVTLGLWTAADRWQTQHGRPPAVVEMIQMSPVAGLIPGGQWPMNPYTSAPVLQGSDAGDFTYTTDGKAFTVIGHLSGGKDFDAAP